MIFRKNILYLFVLGFSSCHSGVSKPDGILSMPPGTPVGITTIDIGSLREVTELNATAAFLQKTVVKANTNGYLRGNSIHLGAFVQAGQLLYTLQNKEASALGNVIETVDTSFHLKTLIDIRANQTGFITQLDRQSGDYVQDGEQLAVISDVYSFAFVLDLPFEMRRYLPQNHRVELILPDSTRLYAIVESAMPTVDPIAQTQRFVLKVSTVDAGRNIPENLIVRVAWVKSIKNSAISLPKSAILTDEMQKEWWVMQLTDDSTAVKVPIRKGIESGERVEIISPIFGSSDRILISGNFGLSDTTHVRIINEKE